MSTAKQVNGNTTNTSSPNNNGSLGKRKKSRGSKTSYLSKWLDKTMHQIQDATPSIETYDTFVNPVVNWPVGSQFAPAYDPYRHIYGCPDPMSLPTYTSYNPMLPFGSEYRYAHNMNKSVNVQRARLRLRPESRPEETNGSSIHSHQGYFQPKNMSDSQDFASLPPIVTTVGDTVSTSDVNTNEKDDGNRRFSDPCVRGLPDVAQPANGDADSDSGDSSLASSEIGGRLVSCLLDQIASLKLANERLTKDLMEARAELENYRPHNVMLQKGSSSSIGATPPSHSLNDNGAMPSQYSPGFLTDLVREIRDASRMREDALYSRVRTMMLERNDNVVSSSETKYIEKALDEIKSSMRASEADRHRMMDRIIKLEDEMRLLRITNGSDRSEKLTNGNLEDAETECIRLRKEIAEMRKAKQNSDEHAFKLERLVTQLRSKFNGLQQTNGPDSLPSEPEHEPNARTRRTSLNSTVVFGPVTDL
ncbi:uncharacterized protein LOC114247198 isoform X1 [Bombyx mandarina]|uniref:Uncharacterized protein LOC114247198 isoform X1 n=1 Tax=Bombyx mandarina TaxID=7092 RepID=A0A6J2K6I3_BOMMA|nr:uncharacterized protein LOC114247198 isoform X1 [Bombyx mandarina]